MSFILIISMLDTSQVVFLVHTHAKEALEWNVLTFLQMIYCSQECCCYHTRRYYMTLEKKKLQHLKQILHTFIRKSNQSKIMVFYHLKKSCCLHGRMCLFSMMIYLPKVILIKKKRKGKKSHIVYLIQDTWKSNSIETQ